MDNENIDPNELISAIEDGYGELLDTNQEIVRCLREKINGLSELKSLFLTQAEKCDELSDLHLKNLQLVAGAFGDIIANEYGFTEEDTDDTEEESDGCQ